MIGNNLLVLNHASLIQMVEHYLNTVVVSGLHPKVKVTAVSEPTVGVFHVRFEEIRNR